MDEVLVDNCEFFTDHLHWTPPLIVTPLSALERHTISDGDVAIL